MPSTTQELIDAIREYAGRLDGSDHDKKALERNISLLEDRLPTHEEHTVPTEAADHTWSSKQQTAITEVFEAMGLDRSKTYAEGDLLNAAEAAGIDNAELALLGFFTPTDSNPDVDYRLVHKFKTVADDGGIVDKPEYAAEGAWANYIGGQ